MGGNQERLLEKKKSPRTERTDMKKEKSRNILSQGAPSWLYVYISSHHFPPNRKYSLYVCTVLVLLKGFYQ